MSESSCTVAVCVPVQQDEDQRQEIRSPTRTDDSVDQHTWCDINQHGPAPQTSLTARNKKIFLSFYLILFIFLLVCM